MHHVLLISLIVFAVAVVGGLAAATVTGLRAWRAFRALRRTTLRRLGELAARITELERHSERAAGNAMRLEQERQRLQESLATAAIVGGAAGEVRALVGLVRGLAPRK